MTYVAEDLLFLPCAAKAFANLAIYCKHFFLFALVHKLHILQNVSKCLCMKCIKL